MPVTRVASGESSHAANVPPGRPNEIRRTESWDITHTRGIKNIHILCHTSMLSEAFIVLGLVGFYSYQRIIADSFDQDASLIALAYLLLVFSNVTLLTEGSSVGFYFVLAMLVTAVVIVAAVYEWDDIIHLANQYTGPVFLFSMCVVGVRLADFYTVYTSPMGDCQHGTEN